MLYEYNEIVEQINLISKLVGVNVFISYTIVNVCTSFNLLCIQCIL